MHEQEKRYETLCRCLAEEREKVQDLISKVPDLEAKATLSLEQLTEASESHTEKIEGLYSREATLKQELEGVHGAIASAEKQSAQIAAGMRAKGVELEKDLARLAKLRAEQADALAEAEAKAARVRAVVAAADHERAEADRRRELLAESVGVLRQVHNEYLSLKGNIRVFCRVRPQLPREADEAARIDISDDMRLVVHSETQKSVTGLTDHTNTWQFSFDHVFGPQSNQSEIFEEIAMLVQSALDGYKVAIFAYGQTGGGKTHTMEGPLPEYRNEENAGVIPRTVDLIFAEVQQMRQKGWSFEVQASCIEVYNEAVRDLLASGPSGKLDQGAGGGGGGGGAGARRDGWLSAGGSAQQAAPAKEASSSGVGSDQYTAKNVENAAAVHALLRRANKERRTASTLCNDRSSRSHAIFQLSLIGRRDASGNSGPQEVRGLLSLVDLAGSERVERSGATGDRMKEAQHINRSLSALGDVIEALARRKQSNSSAGAGGHVPYRNSRLTMLLKDSLGGESKALMFVNISPCLRHLGETVSSLRFASKVHACNVGIAKRNAAGASEADGVHGGGGGGSKSCPGSPSRSARTPAKALTFTPATTPGKDSRPLAERLRELQELRDDGLLTQGEFEQKRRLVVSSC